MKKKLELKSKKTNASPWALVTGASSGIGEATAEKLAELGFNLILIARRSEKLKKIKQSLIEKTPSLKVVLVTSDVRNWPVFKKKLSEVRELKEVTVLINNAGLAKGADSLQDGSVDDWNQMIDTNVKGLLHSTKVVLPYMLKNLSGHIINIGSVAGRWVYPGGAVYCATKAAVSSITEGLRMDLFGKPLRVTNIEPGMVETDFSKVRFGDEKKAAAVYAGMTALTASDIAETIAWVINQPKHVNVQEIVVYPTDQAAVRMISRNTPEKEAK